MARPQFQIRHLMLGGLACALLGGGLRTGGGWAAICLFLGPPALGSMIHQMMGGRGIVGGAIGGMVSGLGFGIYAYYLSNQNGTDYIGPVLGIFVMTSMLTTLGLIVGAVIWGLRLQVEDRDARYPWWSPEPKGQESTGSREHRDD
jgi:Na+/proline symporter